MTAEELQAAGIRVVRVSPHLLMDVHSCESKAWARHVQGYTSKSDAIRMVAGQAFHKAMEVLLDPRLDAQMSGAFVSQWNSRREAAVAAFHTIYDDRFASLTAEKLEPSMTPLNLERILRRWVEMHPPGMQPWKKVLAVEEAFVSREWVAYGGELLSLEDGVHLLGRSGGALVQLIVRPDVVVEDDIGKIRWVDTKTTGWHVSDPTWKLELRLSLQTQLYSDAIVRKYGADRAVYGGWISAIELRKLPGEIDPNAPVKINKDGTPRKERQCQEHKRPYSECGVEHMSAEFVECLTSEEKVAASVRDAEDAALRFTLHTTDTSQPVTAMNVRGTSNRTCRFCPAAGWCDAGRPEAEKVLEHYQMVYEPWPIEAGRRAA